MRSRHGTQLISPHIYIVPYLMKWWLVIGIVQIVIVEGLSFRWRRLPPLPGPPRQPMPQWLQEMTGLSEWPGENPPYIPISRLNLSLVPDIPLYSEAQCDEVSDYACSYDCDKCVHEDDIVTCSRLSQTFDDGPTIHTETLLNRLNHPTTFFTIGRQVVEHPRIVRRQRDDGHLVGTHTWSHPYLPELSNEEIAAQLMWSIWALNATAGLVPTYFRPPYGATDHRVRAISQQLGLRTVLWNRDTLDWQLNTGWLKENDILNEFRLWNRERRPAGLILEHDSSEKTVRLALKIDRQLHRQRTVADCARTHRWYQNEH